MLGSGYLTIGSKTYTPTTFSMSYQAIENSMVSESGKDLVSAVRLNKAKFNVSWKNIDADLKDELMGYTTQPMVSVTFASVARNCRARDAQANMVDWSWKYSGSNGLWNFSMTLTEL